MQQCFPAIKSGAYFCKHNIYGLIVNHIASFGYNIERTQVHPDRDFNLSLPQPPNKNKQTTRNNTNNRCLEMSSYEIK